MGIVIPFPKPKAKPQFNVNAFGSQTAFDFDRRKPARVIRLDQESAKARAYAMYCQASLLDDDNPEAESLYERALLLDPTLAMALNNLGNIRNKQGYKGVALSLYERALKFQPDQQEATYNRAHVRAELGHWEEALEGFKRAVQVAPCFEDGHYMLAFTADQLGLPLLARVHFQQFLTLAPESEHAPEARKALKRLSKAKRPRKRKVKA